MSLTRSLDNLTSCNLSSESDKSENELYQNCLSNDQSSINLNSPTKIIEQKKIVRNPQPKLNDDTLRGPKGLISLERAFRGEQFLEFVNEEALCLLLKKYAHWCNRLFPKYPFDECIEKIEKLGSKRTVQTYVKKMRFGMMSNDAEKIVPNHEDGWDEIFCKLDSLPEAYNKTSQQPHLSPISLVGHTGS